MVMIGAMYTMDNGFTPHAGKNYREYVGRCELVEKRNLDFRKSEVKAEGRKFLERP